MSFDPWHLSSLIMFQVVLWTGFFNKNSPREFPKHTLIMGYCLFILFFQPAGTMNAMSYASQAGAAKFLISWFMLPVFCLILNEKTKLYLMRAILSLILLDLIWIISGTPYGMFIGTTQSTLVAAIFLPLYWEDRFFKYWGGYFVGFACGYIGGAAAWLIIAVHTAILYFRLSKHGRWDFLALCIPLGLGVYFLKTGQAASRMTDIWVPALTWWKAHANIWIGTGPGSYEWLSGLFGKSYMWMHSDWLQFLFEFGILGFLVFLWLAFKALYRLKNSYPEFSVLLALYAGMLVYSPLQFVPVQVLIILTYLKGTEKWK